MTMLPRFFSLIGSDRVLTLAELEHATGPHPLAAIAWDVYEQQFGQFTGATLDPMFHRLTHPARACGSLRLDSGTSVIVVGTGPSLRPNVERLRRLEGRARIFTSPRGADALMTHGIVPDLVLVEHQTALDAHHSARHLGDSTHEVLPACPLVAADWRTPAALLRGVSSDSLFVPAPGVTWGLWPATAAAMAIEAGASRVALLGIDLGTAEQADPAQQPLNSLLALIARLVPTVLLDCGNGATKRGWLKASLAEASGVHVRGRCALNVYPAATMQERFGEVRSAFARHSGMVEHARHALAVALAARGGDVDVARLEDLMSDMLAWRDDVGLRLFVQEGLGLSFLPRLWRSGVDLSLGPALWRPLMLAAHELVGQADALRIAARLITAA